MLGLLSKLLRKRGIEDPKDLSIEERSSYESYKRILTGDQVTVDTIKEFCQNQLRIVENNCDGKTPLTPIQQACIHVYVHLLKTIEAPEAERESLEKYLTQLIESEV